MNKNWIDWLICLFVLTTVVLAVLTLLKLQSCCKGEGYRIGAPFHPDRFQCVQVWDGDTPYSVEGTADQIRCVKTEPCYHNRSCIESNLWQRCGVHTIADCS